jgi:hypothetical protein
LRCIRPQGGTQVAALVEFLLGLHRVSRPAIEVLSYFVRNPAAKDSLEGIARWRLLEQAIHRTITETEAALKWLVQEGYLMEVKQTQSSRLFYLNPERRSQAEDLLRTRQKG